MHWLLAVLCEVVISALPCCSGLKDLARTTVVIVALSGVSADAQQVSGSGVGDQLEFPAEVRVWFRNPDGSCVQCSIGMCGVWQNVPAATTLLWSTEYGSAERGGSGPSRVAAYAKKRSIPIYNVTGSSTWDWMKWAAATGRMAAIGAGTRHFQTLVWWDAGRERWFVCNNNSPTRIDEYTWEGFRRLHLASGTWIVILDTAAPAALPQGVVRWWE